MEQYDKNKMVPNTQWLVTNFKLFNTKYFGGKLPMPKFSYRCPANNWACYNNETAEYNGNKITNVTSSGEMAFTKRYYRAESSIQNSLLHEMIHMYCLFVLKIVPEHGQEFNQLAAKINQDGWQISEKNDKSDTDILIQGEEIPDILNDKENQGDKIMNGDDFNETAQKMFAELQQCRERLAKIQQARQMNECKKLIISEEQEKRLIELLKESDIQKAQMPVDKKMNKPYCIDPEKVLIVKKHLDNNFRQFNYTTLEGGKKKKIKIVGMMDGDNVLKYMYTDDLKDYLIDTFQKMFLDKTERELFLTKVMNAWLNNKIGVHGTLDSNFLM